MAEKKVSVRLVAENGRQVRAELEGVGNAGAASFQKLSKEVDTAGVMLRRLAGIAVRCLLIHYSASSRALRIAISSWSSSVVVSCRRWSASLGWSSSQIPVISNTCTRAWYSSISSPPMA